MKTSIDSIGIEIEGEFSRACNLKLMEMGVMKYDGSVRNCVPTNAYHQKHRASIQTNPISTGEYNSRPVPIANKKEFKKLFDTLEEYKNRGEFHWNKSAGFHIHFSFKPKVPPAIKSTQFTKYALKKLQEEFPLEYSQRTSGTWCRADRLDDDTFVGNRSIGDRYKAINFASFAKHGTLEFRIFPSKHPYKMYEYLRFTIKLINDFLADENNLVVNFETELDEATLPPREITHEAEVLHPRPESLNINE